MRLKHLLSVFLTLLTLGVGQVWGGVSSLTFTSACGGSGTADDDVSWTITSDAAESTFDNSRGVHYGTGSKSVSYIQLQSGSFSKKITKIEVEAAGGNTPSITVTVGGNTFGTTATSITNSNVKYTFQPTDAQIEAGTDYKGVVIVRLAKASKQNGALYVKSVAVTYQDNVKVNVTLNRNGNTEIVNEVLTGTALDNIDGDDAQGGCSAWEFIGWSKTQRAAQDNTTAMTLVTEVEDAGPYFAVYRHTESSGGSDSKTFNFGYTDWGKAAQFSGTTYNEVSQSGSGITVTYSRNNSNLYANTTSLRFYQNNTLTFDAGSKTITAISFTGSVGQSDITTNVTTCTNTSSSLSWAGSASSVTFTRTGSSYATLSSATVTFSSDTYYYSTTATCCTPLGSINGSFKVTSNSASARAFTWDNETTVSDVDHYELSYKEKNTEGNPTSIANNITNSTHAYTHTANLTEGNTYTYYLKAVGASGHCDATEEVDVLIPYATSTVTFNDNGKTSGSVPADITQNTGTTVTVPGNTGNLAKDNYAFGGWNTKDDGTGNNYVADATFTLSNDITLYAKWDCAKKVTLTKGTPSNGSFSLSEANGDKYTCDGSVVVTVSNITPSAGYRFGAITQTGLASGVTIDQENKTVTYAQYANGASEINVEFEQIPVHTITWSVNGETSTTNVTDGDALVLKSNPTSCNTTTYGTFVGWYTTAAGSDSNPSDAVSGTKALASHIPTGDETYYAVWANGTAAGDFALVTDASELNVGDVVTIASVAGNEESGKVIKAYNSGNNWPGTDVTTDASGKIAASTTNMQTFTLEAGTADNSWAFNAGDGYPYAASSGSNHMKKEESKSANSSFSLSIDGQSVASLVAQGANTHNIVRFNPNNGSPIFSCYGSATQSDIYLYKQESGATAFISTCCTKHTITLDDEIANGSVASTESSVCEGTSVTLTATPTPNAGRFNSWSITGLDSYSTTTNPLTISMPDNNITVSATFDALYAITKVEEGGTITLGANYAAENDVVTISAVAKQDYEEPRVLKVYKTGDESTEITITAGAFTMPGYPVTAKVTYTASKTPLDPPTMGDNSNLTYNSVQLNWTNVANNSGYVLTVKQGEDVVEGYNAKVIDQNATSTVISGLEHLTAYTYTLYAKGDGETYVAVNTAAEGNFTTTDYPTIKIYYSENEVLRVAAGEDQKILTDFTLPNSALTGCTQKELVGWTTAANAEYSHDTDAPEGMLLPGATWQIPTNENCTLYAVYAKVTPEVVSWDATAIGNIGASDIFVIVGNNGSNYALPNNGGAATPTVAAVTIADNKLSNAPATTLQWNLSGNSTDGYTFYPNGSTTSWLYLLAANNSGVRIGTGDNKVFTINGGYLYTTQTTDPRYIGIYNSEDWRCYTNTTGNIAGQTFTFYKKNVTPATTTKYATQCMAQVAKPVINGVTDGETYEVNKTVTITCGTSDATIYYSIDGQDPATEYTEPFTLSDNGEYTIRAYATKSGMIDSDKADEVTVTIDKPFTTIASFIEAAPTSAKKLVFTAESNAVVMGVNTNRVYIQDNTGGMCFYKSSHGKTWATGKKVVGTITGAFSDAADGPRMTDADFGTCTATEDGEMPSAVVIDGAIDADKFTTNACKLVTVSNLKFQAQSVTNNNSINIKQGETTYQIYNAFNKLTDHTLPLSTTACTITGILGKNNSSVYQLLPIKAECIVTGANAVLPTLSVSGSTDSENPTAVAENKEITVTPATGMTSTLKDGTADATDLTGATVVTIDVDKAIKVTAAREYYANAEATYYYHADASLTERAISKAAMTNGGVTVKNGDDIVEVAVNGATITLLVAPSTNYHMTSISVTDADAGNVALTTITEGDEYTFTMPAKAVTVSATFAEDDYATINFVKGETAATGSAPASIAKAYVGKQVTMPVNTFALAENDFAGWKHGDNTYAEGAQYTVTAADHEASPISFEAQWTPWPIWATTYTSNIIKSGVNTPDSKVTPEDHKEYDAWKINKGSSITLTIPAGTTTIYGHLVAWKGESAAVTISGSCFSTNRVITPAADDGISNNSPFTLVANGSTFYFKLTPDVAITEDVNITFQTSGTGNNAKRAVVFGVNAVFPEITLDPASYNFGNVRANQTKSQEFTITANDNVTGTLSATLLNNASGKFSVGAIEDNKVTVTFDPDGATSGDFSAQLKISASNAQVTADLTGTAISAEAPEIIVNKNAVVFGQVDPNASVSEAISVQLLHIEGAVSAALSGDDAAKFVLSTTSLTADGDIVVTPNTTEIGIFSATLTLSATDAEEVVIPLSITVANKWAVTYTSNVTVTANENKKVKVGSDVTEYSAKKTNSGATATIHLPMGTQKLHLHMVAWKGEGGNVTVSGDCFSVSKSINVPANDVVSGTGGTYTFTDKLALSYYHEIAIDNEIGAGGVDVEVSRSGSRIVLFGVNEEGGIHELPSGETSASTLPDEVNVSVGNGTTLNVNSNKNFNNVVVEAGGEVSGTNTLTVNNLTIKASSGAYEMPGASGQLTGSEPVINGDLFMEIKLCDGDMNAEASSKWYCIAAPFEVAINGGFFWGDGTPMVLNTHFQLFEWDGDRRATGASGWRRTSGNMKAHTAYFIGFDDERENQNTIKLKAMNNTISNTNTIEAPSHGNDGDYANWNGLGNPNFHHIALNKNVQAFDYNEQHYNPYATGFYNFVVGTPFFIQYAGDIVIEAADNANYRAPKRESDLYSYCVRIGSAEASRADNQIYVRASETASAEFDNERDMITLNNTTSNYGALLWTENYGGKRLAIEEAPLVNGTASYVLTLSAPKAGTYSISVAAPKENADLYLTYDGTIIWNLSEGAYTMDLNKGITNGYGLILRANAPSAATGIDEAESGKQKAESVQKIILDEKVFILRGGKMYDVTGKAVK